MGATGTGGFKREALPIFNELPYPFEHEPAGNKGSVLRIEWRQPASNLVGIYEFMNFEALGHQQLCGGGLPRAVRAANDDDFVHVL